jgi:phage terminase large subunit-like protein
LQISSKAAQEETPMSNIKTYAADPLAFIAAAFTARGMTPAPFQLVRFTSLAPALLSLARGERPDCGRFWWEATKGASKDSDLALCLLWLISFTRHPIDGQVGAADGDQADEMRKAAKDWLHAMPWLAQRIRVHQGKLVCDATKSEIAFVPADAAGGAHGSRCLLYCINEISHISKVEFWQTLLDNASKVPHGLVVVATNAGFVGTDAWKLREIARTTPRWSFHQFTEPAPWLDPAELEEARRRNTLARYSRLFAGVWCSGLGDALEDSDIEAAIDRNIGPLTTRLPGVGFVGGLDLGIKSDHSALVVCGKLRGGETPHYRLAGCQTWAPGAAGKVDLEAVEAGILAAHRAFRLSCVAYDPWQAELMAERLRKRGVRMIEVPFTGKTLDLLARNLLEVFRNRVFSMFDCPRLITDLRKLSIVEKSYGYRLTATRDADGHADAATALVLALFAARDHCQAMPSEPWGGCLTPVTPMGGYRCDEFGGLNLHSVITPKTNLPMVREQRQTGYRWPSPPPPQ